ncbi:hypothetical protein D3C80_1442740 [compost metagenome]
MRGVGVQAVGTGLASDGDLVEEGAFQEHIASGRGHAAVLATHHTGNGQGAGVVGDHQGIATQSDFLAVEQHQLLALFSHAHADPAVDFGEIEGMQGLAQLKHHVVGDVDGSVDAAHVGTTQALDHPQRGRTRQVDVADHTAQVTRAGSRRQYFNRAHFVVGGSNGRHNRASDLGGVQRTDFPGQAGQGQAVATVGGQVDFDAGIFQA